ncbi:SPOR domain-containing protein [Roseospira visakhapatnamensis]|uniref:SPOR domain-containing protein n=1 Tax=Roseospira visakhapatnamensis TaxID=390880 RepID=A0A7W6RCC5_9PROT|nr:SPOR domain-containing protein [Roseospira visakhapatnamensis]MBB4265823.1 hypothetical protein [Roseospira visakhapatnamensis]
MPGMSRFRRDGHEEPVSLDDEMFRLLPEDTDPTLDGEDARIRGRHARDRSRTRGDDGAFGLDDLGPQDGPDPATRFGERRSVMTLLSALVILVVVGGVVWYLLLAPPPDPVAQAPAETTDTAVSIPAGPVLPVVAADTEPYKVRPEDPGGLQVQNTDIRVYDRIGDNPAENDGPRVEQLLPRPAAPVAPPTPVPAPDPPPRVAAAAPATGDAAAPPPPVPQPDPSPEASAPEAPETPAPEPADGPSTVASAPPPAAPAPAAPTPAAPEPAAAPTPAPENVTAAALRGPQVQLAAFRARPAAEATWQRLAKAHPDLLGPLPHAVVFADLGDLGQFYRLRAGPLPSGEAAETLCRSLKQRDVECLVVRE